MSGRPTVSSTSRSAGAAAATARASSGVGLPSRRSSPTGLPVTAASPNAPITSSRIWNASPSGSPYALSAGQQLVGRARGGEHGAEVQRALDRVLAALVPADPLGLVPAPLVADAAEDVEELADVELDRAARSTPTTPRSSRRAGAGRRRRRRGRRRGSRRPRRTGAPRRSSRRRRARPRTRCASSACRGGWRRRPSRRRGTGRRRGAARARAGVDHAVVTPGRRRRRRSPSGRTPAAAACRRTAPAARSRGSARRGRRRSAPALDLAVSRSWRQRSTRDGDRLERRRRARGHRRRLRSSRRAKPCAAVARGPQRQALRSVVDGGRCVSASSSPCVTVADVDPVDDRRSPGPRRRGRRRPARSAAARCRSARGRTRSARPPAHLGGEAVDVDVGPLELGEDLLELGERRGVSGRRWSARRVSLAIVLTPSIAASTGAVGARPCSRRHRSRRW